MSVAQIIDKGYGGEYEGIRRRLESMRDNSSDDIAYLADIVLGLLAVRRWDQDRLETERMEASER